MEDIDSYLRIGMMIAAGVFAYFATQYRHREFGETVFAVSGLMTGVAALYLLGTNQFGLGLTVLVFLHLVLTGA